MILSPKAFLNLFILCFTLISYAPSALAVKESRLWLPKKHKSAMPQLIQAAQFAEKNPECLEVLNGQMDRKRSKKAKALVFRIDCRNENGLTFSLTANAGEDDSLSRLSAGVRKKTHTVKPIDAAEGWKVCRLAITDSLKKMIKPVLLEDPVPKPYITHVGESIFYVDFDAQTVEGYPVYFVSICKVLPSGKSTVDVKPRKLVAKPKGFDIKRKAIKSTDKVKPNDKIKATHKTKTAEKIDTAPPKVVAPNSQNQVDDDWQEVIETPPEIPKGNTVKKLPITDEDGWEIIEGN